MPMVISLSTTWGVELPTAAWFLVRRFRRRARRFAAQS